MRLRLVQIPKPNKVVTPMTLRASVSQGTAVTELPAPLIDSCTRAPPLLNVPAADVREPIAEAYRKATLYKGSGL